MCGIAGLLVPEDAPAQDELWRRLIASVKLRGPDAHGQVEHRFESEDGTRWTLRIYCSVLALRGPVTQQPFCTADGSLFAFNGEVFGGVDIPPGVNDAAYLASRLPMLDLDAIEGPFAFIHIDAASSTLSFGRDRLGRRSLLVRLPDEACPAYIITSCGLLDEATLSFAETEPGQVTRMDLRRLSRQSSKLPPPAYSFVSHRSPCHKLIVALSAPPPITSIPREVDGDLLKRFEGALRRCYALTRAATLGASIARRVLDVPLRTEASPSAARVGILFSGGIDCATMALLASRSLPPNEPIDLINVAFENPRVLKAHALNTYDVPDRLTGRASLVELRRVDPERHWRFVEVDVTYAECLEHKQRILNLMAPSSTVMDHSIAMALYFAARGRGRCDGLDHFVESKVLHSGLGADEILGGYSRHRRAFNSTAASSDDDRWRLLAEEMQMDLDRIGTRNLGRDDRVLSSWAREARYPYLDEQVLGFLATVPLELKCDPRLPEGQGDKILLRRLANSLGLHEASKLRKRAMQFGSRSAKQDVSGLVGTATQL